MAAQIIVSQSVNYPNCSSPKFAFLAKPPPPQKKRPNLPLPPLPSSAQNQQPVVYSSIVAWAALVQPGSPAPRSPRSPLRRPSITSQRRPSISRLNRRPSISHGRAPSGSLIHLVDTPTARSHSTPSQFDFDLTGLGYNSVFIHLPKTPTTPSPYLRQRSGTTAIPLPPVPKSTTPQTSAGTYTHLPVPRVPVDQPKPVKRLGMKRFRSLTLLRARADSKSQADAPKNILSPTLPPSPSKAEILAVSVVKRKKAKYAYVRPPPPLANELALMQFADGGSMEKNVKRAMEAQAKAAAGSHYAKGAQGLGDVYRSENGGIWWDADEEMEYVHLLEGTNAAVAVNKADEMEWVDFSADAGEPCALFLDSSNKGDEGQRRGSLSSLDSDLDLKYHLPLPENDTTSHPVEDRVLASKRVGGPGMSVLSLPSRPRRKALHLHKPEFLVDMAAFGPRSPLPTSAFSTTPKPKGKARRRPAPLTLGSLSNTTRAHTKAFVKRAAHHSPTPATSTDKVKKEFLENSFIPPPAPAKPPTTTVAALVPIPAPPALGSQSMKQLKTKPPRHGMRGFFFRRAD